MHKILLVEDDEIIRQQVKQLLEQWGYEVVAVEDFMDVQFGKPGTPERERFREEARIYVNGYAQTAECKNSQKRRK